MVKRSRATMRDLLKPYSTEVRASIKQDAKLGAAMLSLTCIELTEAVRIEAPFYVARIILPEIRRHFYVRIRAAEILESSGGPRTLRLPVDTQNKEIVYRDSWRANWENKGGNGDGLSEGIQTGTT